MDKLEELRNVIKQWNANRLDLFEISAPNEVNSFSLIYHFCYRILFAFNLEVAFS